MMRRSGSADFLTTLFPGGRSPQPGELKRFPQLAATIAQTLTAHGVPTTCDDLAAVQPEWVEPLSVSYRGHDVLALPPKSQETVALEALGILDGFDLAGMDPADRQHHQSEALRIRFAFAIDNLVEPTEPMLEAVRRGISPEGLAEARGRIDRQAVDAPRFRVVMTNDQVSLEAEFPESVRRDLAARGQRLGTAPDVMGAAQMVRIHRGEGGIGPCLECGVDHRLDGVALGW